MEQGASCDGVAVQVGELVHVTILARKPHSLDPPPLYRPHGWEEVA